MTPAVARRLAAFLLVLMVAPRTVRAADTDVVLLATGDRVTGEVKGLERGRLELKTSTMSTVYIEWIQVVEVTTATLLEVQTDGGDRYVGRLAAGGPGKLVIETASGQVAVDLLSVVRMAQIGRRFWQSFNGSVSLGSSYTKSSGVGQSTVDAEARFRRPGYELVSAFDGSITATENEPSTSRSLLQFDYSRFLRDRWLVPAVAQFERNKELGLRLRSTFGAGVGRFVVQSNRAELIVAGSLVGTGERPLEGDDTRNAEALLTARYSFFTYDTPKTTISLRQDVFPSLSDPGRVRLNFDTSVKREIVKDFTIGFTVYDSFDNRPPTEGASKHDVGYSLSIGWQF